MKKIALICIMVMSVFSLTGCGSKTALTSDEFNKIFFDYDAEDSDLVLNHIVSLL